MIADGANIHVIVLEFMDESFLILGLGINLQCEQEVL